MNYKEYVELVDNLSKKIDDQIVEDLARAILDAYEAGNQVFIIGNGGSGANASHLCEDLMKGTLHDFENQKRLKVASLTDNTPAILAWANDTSYDRIFLEQLRTYAESGDLLISISGSGNSPNVLRAVEWAKENGLKTFGITGYDGGKLGPMCDKEMRVDSFNMGAVEAVHGIVFHYLIEILHERFKALAAA
ncbi:MAG: SIS domain-containing protein [Candidatus Omnitrophica bacterium]|nr:SIS domain-containing protein [Candidatus Omnitrophota bacterium]